MGYPTPPESKSAVKRAGKAISEGTSVPSDFEIVDKWRSAHGYVINNFQIWIKRKIQKLGLQVEFAQRLKRRNTVFDKLSRRNDKGELLISDVSAMHDFAGCRLIFEDLTDLKKFRDYMHSAKVMKGVKHQLRHSPEKYDYIEHPKASGYRGIHDVYRHFPRGSERDEGKKPWDNLLVEIQYRTRAQHAWATAVEISDLVDGQKTKFEMDQSNRGKFFAIASEIIGRNHEHLEKAFLGRTTTELKKDLQDLENELGILQRLSALKTFEDEDKLKQHNVLNITYAANGELTLEVLPFAQAADAIEKATELESSGSSLNAVYVRADNPAQLRSAYRNYFNDPVDFVKIIRHESDVV